MTEPSTAEQLAVASGQIPTDEAGLYQFIANLGRYHRWLVPGWLKAQENRDYTTLVDRITERISQEEVIQETRAALRQAAVETTAGLARLIGYHRELAGAALYDVEFSESPTASLALRYLEDAQRALDTFRAINPDGVLTNQP